MTRYRAEVYDSDFNFISYGPVSEKTIQLDYLVEDVSMITIPKIIPASVSNIVAVRQNGIIYMHGIISDVSYSQGKTTISFVHFMSNLNVNVMVDPRVFETTPAEEWLCNKLLELYAGSDTFQNLEGFSCTYNSQTMIDFEYEMDSEGNVSLADLNLFSFAQDLLTKYNVILSWSVDFAAKTIQCTIDTIDTESVWTIKLGLADTPDYTIDIHTIEGTYNKIKYYNNANFSNTVTYYLHSDGTVDSDSTTDRLMPVHFTEKTAEADDTEGQEKTFAEVALEDAKASMLNTNFNHEIIVTFNTESKLVSVGNIGQLYNLVTPEGVVYNSVLTGFEQINVKYLRLVFGYIRTNLTTILKMQRRKK